MTNQRIATVAVAGAAALCGAGAQTCRDQNLWPFNASSVWNTPLGSDAVFVPAGLFNSTRPGEEAPYAMQSDDDWFFAPSLSDPVMNWYSQGTWGTPNNVSLYCTITGELVESFHFPDVIIDNFGNNNAAAILDPRDNRTLLLIQPIYRCAEGAPVTALKNTPGGNRSDIRGAGTGGGHGGSGLSAIGGTIRRGELLPSAPPIPHALKLEFWAHQYYYRPPGCDRSECFTYPAVTCDGHMCDPTRGYNGTDALFRPGALLAVARGDAARLNATLRTLPARKIAQALATYGGYVVDDTAWNATSICTEKGVQDEFNATYGYPFLVHAGAQGPAAAWYDDLLDIFRALSIVSNNSPQSPGGGGAPLAPPPPPFCD